MLKNKIVFLCTGNICRSPMAELLFKHAVKALPKDNPLHNLEIISAGTMAEYKMSMSHYSELALKQLDVNITKHISQQITDEIVEESLAIFAMDKWHIKVLKQITKVPLPKLTCTMLDLVESSVNKNIADPYGGSMDSYLVARDDILKSIPYIIKLLENELRNNI